MLLNSGCCCVPSALFGYVVQEAPVGHVPPVGIPFGSPILTTRIRSARVWTSKLAVVEKFVGPKLVLAPVEPTRKWPLRSKRAVNARVSLETRL